jgi:Uma2 family endonuclease
VTITPLRKQFTVDDYARMRETGILTEDDRVELLDGEIYIMSPIGPLHVAIVNKLNKILGVRVGDRGIISIQNPIRLDKLGEPQPDIAILHPRDDFYTQALATPDDILLVIEVADTTLEYDREQKLPRYAQAHISEVWIVDVAAQTIEQHTQPYQGVYTQVRKVLFGSEITSSIMSDISFTTDLVF